MRDLPTGTLTFLFTDIEGSTRLLDELGAEAYSDALAGHRQQMRTAFAHHGGVEVDTQGDAFFVAFRDAPNALAAAAEATKALSSGPIRVRMGLHTGTPHLGPEGYVGHDVHLGARIAAVGHGGQVLLSKQTAQLVDEPMADLGEHRLKDFAAPVWIYQLGTERFPPLRTISNTNLPRPASAFVGRDKEVAEIGTLLGDGSRLVTLTGPGGTGKTRLAIETAGQLVPEFRNGVFWVGLASLRDAALVPDTIAQTLGARDGLAAHIGERQMLLVLDNLEQLVGAAPELASLVETCPNLRLLVTSRERLRVRGEVEYAVPPLATAEAVELFSELSQLEADETIADLCRHLDNLPLAVELAAARTGVLSPAQILERLAKRLDLLRGGRDAEARQQTLRATIEWSHELLSAPEQELFARLSVFRGGCTLQAAEEVAGAELDVLQSLVDKSLVNHAGERFTMLETVREFAIERLNESAQAEAIRRRHAAYFLALAEAAEPHLEKNPQEWVTRLETDIDNLRAALDRLQTSGESQSALRLAGALAGFWEIGHLTEGWLRLENLLRGDERSTAARAKALAGAALVARQSGAAETARLRAEEALTLHRELGNVWGAADASMTLGLAVADEGDFARARQLYEDSARLFREAGDEDKALFCARLLGWAYEELGDRERARAVLEDAFGRAQVLGNKQVEGQALANLAFLAEWEGRGREAVSMMKDVLRIDRGRGVPLQTAYDLTRFARILALAGGSSADAARLLSSAEALRDEIGAGAPPFLATIIEDALAAIHTRLDDSDFAEAWRRGRKLNAAEAIELGLGLEPNA
jgi:predicted ATPase